MRKTFVPLDDVLIEHVFQPASDLMFVQFGLIRATLACFCIDAASLAWIVSRTAALSDAVKTTAVTTVCFDAAVLLLGLAALISLRTVFRRAATKQQANPLRLAMQPHRAVVLLMLAARVVEMRAPELADAADLGMLICATSALYLGACAEHPPIRRSVPAFAS